MNFSVTQEVNPLDALNITKSLSFYMYEHNFELVRYPKLEFFTTYFYKMVYPFKLIWDTIWKVALVFRNSEV